MSDRRGKFLPQPNTRAVAVDAETLPILEATVGSAEGRAGRHVVPWLPFDRIWGRVHFFLYYRSL